MATSKEPPACSLSEEWRRHQLEKIVKESNPHVQALCEGLLSRVSLLGEPARQMIQSSLPFRRRNLQELEKSIKVADPIAKQQRQAELAALLHFEHGLRHSYEALLARKRCSCFPRSHQILVRQRDQQAQPAQPTTKTSSSCAKYSTSYSSSRRGPPSLLGFSV